MSCDHHRTREKLSPDQIERGLWDFSNGAEPIHPLGVPFTRFFLSNGVQWLCKQAGAFWLALDIAAYQGLEKIKAEELQIWTLERNPQGEGAVLTCMHDVVTHGDEWIPQGILHRVNITATDFPLSRIKLYCGITWLEGDTPARLLYLPSEY